MRIIIVFCFEGQINEATEKKEKNNTTDDEQEVDEYRKNSE